MTAMEVQTWDVNFAEFVEVCTLNLELSASITRASSSAERITDDESVREQAPDGQCQSSDARYPTQQQANARNSKDKHMLCMFETVAADRSGKISCTELKELLGQKDFMGAKLQDLAAKFGEINEDGLLDEFAGEVMKSLGGDDALIDYSEFRREFSPFFDDDGNIVASNAVVQAELSALSSIVCRLRSLLVRATEDAMKAHYASEQQLLQQKECRNLEMMYSDEAVAALELEKVNLQSRLTTLNQEKDQANSTIMELKFKNAKLLEDIRNDHKSEQVIFITSITCIGSAVCSLVCLCYLSEH